MEDIDIAVAVKVMGLHKVMEEGFWPNSGWVWRNAAGAKVAEGSAPRYSTDIKLAWTILDKFNADGWVTVVGSMRGEVTKALSWYAIIGMAKPKDPMDLACQIAGEADEATPELAICVAALRAVETQKNKNIGRG